MRRSSILIILGLIGIFLSTVIFSKCAETKTDNETIDPSELFFGEPVVQIDTIRDTVYVDREIPVPYNTRLKKSVPEVEIQYITKEVPVIEEKVVYVDREVFVEVPVVTEIVREVEVIREVEVATIDPQVTAWLFDQISNVKLTEDSKFALYGNAGIYSLPDSDLGYNFGFSGHYRGVEAGISYDPINQYYQARVGYRIFQTKEKDNGND